MPSSIRPTSTISGVWVVSARYPKIARPNPNAMGTPANTQNPATPTKKMMRLRLPSGRSGPFSSQNPAIAAAPARRPRRSLQQPEHGYPDRTRQEGGKSHTDAAPTAKPQQSKQRHQADADR